MDNNYSKELVKSINRLTDNIKLLMDAIDSVTVALDRQSVLDLYDFYTGGNSDFYVPMTMEAEEIDEDDDEDAWR